MDFPRAEDYCYALALSTPMETAEFPVISADQ
jgi:hypothetical protein